MPILQWFDSGGILRMFNVRDEMCQTSAQRERLQEHLQNMTSNNPTKVAHSVGLTEAEVDFLDDICPGWWDNDISRLEYEYLLERELEVDEFDLSEEEKMFLCEGKHVDFPQSTNSSSTPVAIRPPPGFPSSGERSAAVVELTSIEHVMRQYGLNDAQARPLPETYEFGNLEAASEPEQALSDADKGFLWKLLHRHVHTPPLPLPPRSTKPHCVREARRSPPWDMSEQR